MKSAGLQFMMLRFVNRPSIAAALTGAVVTLWAAGEVRAEEAPAASYRSLVLSDRPFAYYRFDEQSGETAKDETGNGHDALYKGAIRLEEASASTALGTAVGLGGDKARVHIPKHADFKFGTGDLTVECWLNCRETVATRGDLLSFKGEGKDFALFKPNGNANLLAYAKPGRAFQAQTDPLTLNVWHHAVYVRCEGVDFWYVDGELSGTATGHVMAIDMNADILIGANHCNNPEVIDDFCLWNGAVDELAFYRFAMSAERVSTHFRKVLTEQASASMGGNKEEAIVKPVSLPVAARSRRSP
jgi:hypothetical protein